MTRVPAVGLAAGFLGLVVSPAFYVAIGVLLQVPVALGITSLVAVVAASGYLLRRWLSKPERLATSRLSAPEVLAVLTVLGFSVLAPQGVFVASSRRVAFAFTVFAAAWLVCLPVPLLRRTALEIRLSKLPVWLTTGVLLALLSTSLTFTYWFLSRPEHLI